MVEQVLPVPVANHVRRTAREGNAMGWRARSEQEEVSGREMMHWLLETYEAAGAPPEPAVLVRVPERSDPIGQPEVHATPVLALAVLERPIDPLPEDPVPEDPQPGHEPEPAPALFAERRLERRVDCALTAAAAAQSHTAETALGEAVDISVSGLHLVMDKVAAVGPIDLIVADVVVDARVVGYQAIGDGRHSWHVHVLDADDAWLGLVQSA